MLMLILLIALVVFVLIPAMTAMDKRRKSAFEERKKRLMAIGSQYDDDPIGTDRLNELKSPAASAFDGSDQDANPYRPPSGN
ncbi:hypothetical protein [Roseiconus lacunae]|uniref:Uncharacterized protein n=1 Tax=Roseiconus lacunae TaxID=2605694 RepID=A0ABT7PHS1_9BACT|nr:hypothetical protein [Roseiconus lacunae]MCD0461214.1 hypothetical protein [Roseiconus lacunae]MDM4016040.1 hypothetical protein [Roseiconus lacunae]WRQ51626.1 hypothetical protein U8335_03600 [Stieleria sp. HD01]